ncbi:hypothetical protein [Alteribacter aurantiacus]|uniref:hypothetical protein n=1 Tax=Alteribacter aurantiacus TaxID=254410 RepID=UPI0003F56AF4
MWNRKEMFKWRLTWKGVLVGVVTLTISTVMMLILPESEWMYRASGCVLLLGFSSVSLPRAVKEARPHLYRGWIKKYGEWLEPSRTENENRSHEM